jgi:SAM-dependent methyltransferase
MSVNRWPDVEHALTYLARADQVPHRTEGEAALLEFVPATPRRVLDLGTGDGRLLALVRTARPGVAGLAVDFSPPMLERARERFADVADVAVVEHDLDVPLPELGRFDLVVSSFAIHHVDDDRKRALFAEVFAALAPGGVFLNLEHVASPTPELHDGFLAAMGTPPEQDDPSNKLASVEVQLGWLRASGFEQVDCHWKWRELALLGATRP